MTIIYQSFKKRNRTLNVKNKIYEGDRKKIIRDDKLKRLEREPSKCQQMLKINRY